MPYKVGDDAWNIYEKESNIEEIANALLVRHGGIKDNAMAKRMAYRLNAKGYKVNDVVEGKTDNDVYQLMRAESTFISSVKSPNEKPYYLPLKNANIRRNNRQKEIMVKILAGCLGVAGAFVIGHYVKKQVEPIINEYQEVKINSQVSASIGMLASNSSNGTNIVDQNINILDYNNGYPVYEYKHEDIAQDILNICASHPELLEISLYDTYFNMDISRLDNMDIIFASLKRLAVNNENINNELAGCDTFLDYLIKKEIISKDDTRYEEVVKAISEYKNSLGFNSLSHTARPAILYLINKCEERKVNLNVEYMDVLSNLVSEQNINTEGVKR